MKERKKQYLSEQVILSVMSGDKEAMEQNLAHYDWFINYILDALICSHQLNPDLIPIEDMKQNIRMELFRALKNFK